MLPMRPKPPIPALANLAIAVLLLALVALGLADLSGCSENYGLEVALRRISSLFNKKTAKLGSIPMILQLITLSSTDS